MDIKYQLSQIIDTNTKTSVFNNQVSEAFCSQFLVGCITKEALLI